MPETDNKKSRTTYQEVEEIIQEKHTPQQFSEFKPAVFNDPESTIQTSSEYAEQEASVQSPVLEELVSEVQTSVVFAESGSTFQAPACFVEPQASVQESSAEFEVAHQGTTAGIAEPEDFISELEPEVQTSAVFAEHETPVSTSPAFAEPEYEVLKSAPTTDLWVNADTLTKHREPEDLEGGVLAESSGPVDLNQSAEPTSNVVSENLISEEQVLEDHEETRSTQAFECLPSEAHSKEEESSESVVSPVHSTISAEVDKNFPEQEAQEEDTVSENNEGMLN